MSNRLPPIATPADAEAYVQVFVNRVLFTPKARVTSRSRDEGLDVVGGVFSVQVKRYTDTPIGRPEIQRLVGAARSGSIPIFFTSSRYTNDAESYAQRHGVALYVFPFNGETLPTSMNEMARRIVDEAEYRRVQAPRGPGLNSRNGLRGGGKIKKRDGPAPILTREVRISLEDAAQVRAALRSAGHDALARLFDVADARENQ